MVRIITATVLVVLGGLLLVEAGFSLEWRMVHDAPLLTYMAYGMSRFGYVPYVDFFDMNAPGAHYFHVLVGRLFGYDDLALRLADLVWLTLLMSLTWLTLRRAGRRVGFCGAILFGLMYLATGPNMSLQREYIALVPIAGAVLAATSLKRFPGAARWLIVGVLFGVAATIKPAAVIGFPAVVVLGVLEARAPEGGARSPGSSRRVLVFSVLGFLVPLAATALHLARIGALTGFIEMARSYWPLYGELSRTHVVIGESERAAYLAREWVTLGGRTMWLLPAAVGSFAALFRSTLDRPERRRVLLLIALVVCYSLYPVIGGKFWTYHWFPFSYFVVLLASLALVEATRWKRLRWVPILALVIAAAVGIRPPAEFRARLAGEEWLDPRVRRADRIAGYLTENVRPGDTVQPLDWTGGAVHAMLMAEAPLGTPFVYDFHFYHHVSTDYIRSLRSRFLEGLEASPPRFVIRVETMRPWVSGEDTEKRFLALDRFVATNYEEAHSGFGYRVYERRQKESTP
jgi:hypothetical protein